MEFPTPYPVTLRFQKKIAAEPDADPISKRTGDYGLTYSQGRKIVIVLAVRPSIILATSIETLLHEWAHAASIRHSSLEKHRAEHGGHDDQWALVYGKIYRRFYDRGGSRDSRSF